MTNHISKTAWYTLGVRVWDAAQPKPLCGDYLANQLVSDDSQAVWRDFQRLSRPNASNAMRHAIIDEHLQVALNQHADARIVIIGAGFDTRAFRLHRGHWIEFDEPAIINYKNARMPAVTAPNPLERIPIEFARESLAERLTPHATCDPAWIVIEGVLMYLTKEQRRQMMIALQSLFPQHIVICDLMRKSFCDRYSSEIHGQLMKLGAPFADLVNAPETEFTAVGYRELSRTSIPLLAAQRGGIDISPLLIRWFLPTLRNGYSVWQFAHDGKWGNGNRSAL
ncbi:MAG TPA: class I SAM-dependent methyltransferase [Pirellulaceae bacterium]|nr:class I SAM-dependent methyltransferase [Pirellulaceae bacterium]